MWNSTYVLASIGFLNLVFSLLRSLKHSYYAVGLRGLISWRFCSSTAWHYDILKIYIVGLSDITICWRFCSWTAWYYIWKISYLDCLTLRYLEYSVVELRDISIHWRFCKYTTWHYDMFKILWLDCMILHLEDSVVGLSVIMISWRFCR